MTDDADLPSRIPDHQSNSATYLLIILSNRRQHHGCEHASAGSITGGKPGMTMKKPVVPEDDRPVDLKL